MTGKYNTPSAVPVELLLGHWPICDRGRTGRFDHPTVTVGDLLYLGEADLFWWFGHHDQASLHITLFKK